MASKALPSPEVLRQLLRYEPETGKLFWLVRSQEWFVDGRQTAQRNSNIWNGKFANREAFTALDGHGYRCGNVLGKLHRAHRVVFAMVNGVWPCNQIDHIDGNRINNRIENLRDVTNKENGRNAKRLRTNTSGVTGVSWLKKDRKWRAYIRFDDKKSVLGEFVDFNEAVKARKDAEARLGFHINHGRA